jgi:hypothetical protein
VHRHQKNGVQLKQKKLEKIGRYAGIVGAFSVYLLPRVFNVRYKGDFRSSLIYLALVTLGCGVFLVGIRLISAAFKTPEETPGWIKWVSTLLR